MLLYVSVMYSTDVCCVELMVDVPYLQVEDQPPRGRGRGGRGRRGRRRMRRRPPGGDVSLVTFSLSCESHVAYHVCETYTLHT